MPQIQYTKEGGTIRWDKDDWLAGLHPQHQYDTTGVLKSYPSQNLYNESVTPFRELGALFPGYLPEAATNNSQVTSILLNAVVNNTDAYFVSSGAKVHKITNITYPLSLETTSWAHTITLGGGHAAHSSVAGEDIVLYNCNVGGIRQRCMFVSWNDNTDWDVAQYTFATASTVWDDDFMSTASASPLASPYLTGGKGYPHPMIVGDDDILYIGSSNYVHAYDGATGANGTFYPAVLTLPAGFVVKSFAKIENYLIVFAYYNNTNSSYLGQAKAYFWNYLDLDPTKVVDLDDNKVCAAFQYGATVGCITAGNYQSGNSQSKPFRLRIWNGAEFKTVANFGGEEPINGGVQVIEGSILINTGTKVFQYGSTLLKPVINELFQPHSNTGSSAGLLKQIWTDTLVSSSGTTSSGGLELLNNDKYDSGSAMLPWALPQFPRGKRGRLKNISVRFHSTVTASANKFQLQIQTEQLQLKDVINSGDNVISASTETMIREYTTLQNGDPFPVFTAITPILTWAVNDSTKTECLAVEEVTAEFEFINYTVT